MGKPSKKSVKIFVDLVTDMLIRKGATQQPDPFEDRSEFHLETEGGLMRITFDREDQYIWSVFGKFDDVKRARELFTCSRYSGKHNIHLSENLTPTEAFAEVKEFYALIN